MPRLAKSPGAGQSVGGGVREQMTALERFLKYITFDTQSEEGSEATPSTEKQRALGRVLARELAEMGLEGACRRTTARSMGGSRLPPDGRTFR